MDFTSDGGSITAVPSGGGTLGLTAAHGGNYGEITNSLTTPTQAGYGSSVYTRYGSVVTGGAFYESTAYYIDTAWGAGGFWIDTTPKSDPSYDDETNFRLSSNGLGTVNVQLVGYETALPDGSFPSLNISNSGWYTFKTTFEDSGGFVKNVLSVLDAGGSTIASASQVSTMPYAALIGPSYGDWTTVWQNGFANDVIGIDDVEVGTLTSVPLPSSANAGLGLIVGLGALAGIKRMRRQTA